MGWWYGYPKAPGLAARGAMPGRFAGLGLRDTRALGGCDATVAGVVAGAGGVFFSRSRTGLGRGGAATGGAVRISVGDAIRGAGAAGAVPGDAGLAEPNWMHS